MNIEIPSDIKNIRKATTEVIDYIKNVKSDTDQNILFDIKLCVEEAIRNAMVHGNKLNKNLKVSITCDLTKNGYLKIAVEDKGKGFNIKALPDPTDDENLYKESGRGIYIMHRLMDKIEYNDKGNVVTMEKRSEA